MKFYNKLSLGLVALTMTFASCSDEYINGENQYTLETETAAEIIADDPAFIDSYINGIWSWMSAYAYDYDIFGVTSIHHATEMMGEDLVMYNSNWFIYDYQLDYRLEQWSRPFYFWSILYTMITKSNEIIDFFPEEPTEIASRGAYGNALAVRAYSYLYLTQLFANPTDSLGNVALEAPGVPIVVSSSEGYEQTQIEEFMGRNTIGKVFEMIENDITKAIDMLEGYERPNKNYINQSVAQGIAARYYLLAQKWAEAEAMAKAARADYPVMSGTAESNGIRDGFMDVNNTEWMWGFDHTSETQTTYASFFSHMSNLTPGYSGLAYTGRGIDVRLYAKMSDTDYRKIYWYNDAEGNTQATVAKETAGSKLPMAILKHGWDGTWTMDYLYMRGAEMVLIEAEALVRQQKSEAAATVLSELMSQRDPSWNKTMVTLEDVYTQRRLELIGEGFAYYDLKRMNRGIDRDYDGSNHMAGVKLEVPAGDVRWTFQIPLREIQENTHIDEDEQND